MSQEHAELLSIVSALESKLRPVRWIGALAVSMVMGAFATGVGWATANGAIAATQKDVGQQKSELDAVKLRQDVLEANLDRYVATTERLTGRIDELLRVKK